MINFRCVRWSNFPYSAISAPASKLEFQLPAPREAKNSSRVTLELNLPPPLALPKFDFEFERTPSPLGHNEHSTTPTNDRVSRRHRASVFDAVADSKLSRSLEESTNPSPVPSAPTASSQSAIPNIVTSWDDPPIRMSTELPKSRPLASVRPSRHLRTVSSSTTTSTASDATFKVPLPRPSSRSPHTQLTPVAGSPEKPAKSVSPSDAEVLKRASSLRTVASSIISKDRSSKVSSRRPAEENKVSAPPTAGTLLRRSKTTISSGSIASETLSVAPPSDVAKVTSRISSLMQRTAVKSDDRREPSSATASGPMGIRRLPSITRAPAAEAARSLQAPEATGSSRVRSLGRAASAQVISHSSSSRHPPDDRIVAPEAPIRRSRSRPRVADDAEVDTTGKEGSRGSRLQDWATGVAHATSRADGGEVERAVEHPQPSTLVRKSSGIRRLAKPADESASQPKTYALPRAAEKETRVLGGLREWADGVASATSRAIPETRAADEAPRAVATTGLVRKRSLREPTASSAGAAPSGLRRTKTSTHFNGDGAAAAPTTTSSSSGALRPRTSIYSLRGGSKMAASVEVLPLVPAPAVSVPEPKPAAHGVRTRPSSMYMSKAGSMSTSALTDGHAQAPQRPSSRAAAAATATGSTLSRGMGLLRRPSISTMSGQPPATTSSVSSSLTAAKSLARASTSLLRSKSRGNLPAR